MTVPLTSDTSLSAIKIFNIVEKEIRNINVYPLCTDNINIQQDAYKRLAASVEEEYFEPFATIEQARKEKDTDLRFIVQFTSKICIFGIEGIGELPVAYADIAPTDTQVTEQIMALMIMLSNGQLSCLLTLRHGKLCASEIIYREKTEAAPMSISLEANYPKFIKNDSLEAYEVDVLKNSFPIAYTTLPDKFILQASLIDGSPLDFKRTFKGNVLTPLSKTEYTEIMSKVTNTLVGAKDNNEFEQQIGKSWVLWLTSLSIVISFLIWAPDNIFLYAAPFVGFAAFFVAGILASNYLIYLQKLRLSQPDHWLLKFDQLLTLGNIFTILYLLALMITLASLTFPIYATKADRQIVTLYQLSEVTSPFALLPLISLALALVLGLSGKAIMRIYSAILATTSVIALCYINFTLTYTGEDVNFPEPHSTIAISAYLVLFLYSTGILIAARLRSAAKRDHSDTQEL